MGQGELERLRSAIDEVDEVILEAFRIRMRICSRIADVKRARGLPLDDRGREELVYSKARDEWERALLETVVKACKHRQARRLEGGTR